MATIEALPINFCGSDDFVVFYVARSYAHLRELRLNIPMPARAKRHIKLEFSPSDVEDSVFAPPSIGRAVGSNIDAARAWAILVRGA